MRIDKQKAVDMRQLGWSYTDISEQLGITKYIKRLTKNMPYSCARLHRRMMGWVKAATNMTK